MTKTVFISGASGSLGVKIVKFYIKKKFNIICTVYRNSKLLTEQLKSINKKNKNKNKLEIFQVDFSNEDNLKNIIRILNKKNMY